MMASRVEQIDGFVLKLDHHYRLGGHQEAPGRLPGTDYFFEPQWRQVYSRKTEICLVKITTEGGVSGWGEAQAPIAPEVTAALLSRLIGPAVLGQDALAHEVIYDRLYQLMAARGQQYGYFLDAVGAIDTALWDIRGRMFDAPVAALLGGPFRSRLPAYVSGLRKPTLEQRLQVARDAVAEGYQGVKIFSARTPVEVGEELEAVREAAGAKAFLAFDAIHAYDVTAALRIGATLDRLSADWMEAPVGADNIAGHARLAASLSTAVAGGEILRSTAQFLPWILAGALGVVQPDVVRCGITAAKRVADLAQSFQLRTALHLGVCSGIGVAATWQVASALPSFAIQEHQLDLFETANRVLKTPLRAGHGCLVVPMDPGLGVEVDEEAVRTMAVAHWCIRSDS